MPSRESVCCQGVILVPDMFYNFYLVKNHKIASHSLTTEAREKISTYLESLEFYKFFDVCLTKFENYQVLVVKLSTDLQWQPSYLLDDGASAHYFIITKQKYK